MQELPDSHSVLESKRKRAAAGGLGQSTPFWPLRVMRGRVRERRHGVQERESCPAQDHMVARPYKVALDEGRGSWTQHYEGKLML